MAYKGQTRVSVRAGCKGGGGSLETRYRACPRLYSAVEYSVCSAWAISASSSITLESSSSLIYNYPALSCSLETIFVMMLPGVINYTLLRD